MPHYAPVPAATVPYNTRQSAQKALDAACARLGLRLPPPIIWVCGPLSEATESPGTISYPLPIAGLTNGSAWAMWIRADLTANQAARVASHEAAHLHHRLRNRPDALSREDEEADCDLFAEQVVKALGLG